MDIKISVPPPLLSLKVKTHHPYQSTPNPIWRRFHTSTPLIHSLVKCDVTSKLRFVSRVVGHRLDRLDRLGISRQRCLNFGENCNTHERSNIYKVEPLYVVLNRAMQCFFVPQYPSRQRTCRHRVFPMFTRRMSRRFDEIVRFDKLHIVAGVRGI